jgi:hypothetical protein
VKGFFSNPWVRLAGRAIAVGITTAVTQIHNSNGTEIAWQSVVVAAVLAALEVFTPLNALVGVFKTPPSKTGS